MVDVQCAVNTNLTCMYAFILSLFILLEAAKPWFGISINASILIKLS